MTLTSIAQPHKGAGAILVILLPKKQKALSWVCLRSSLMSLGMVTVYKIEPNPGLSLLLPFPIPSPFPQPLGLNLPMELIPGVSLSKR